MLPTYIIHAWLHCHHSTHVNMAISLPQSYLPSYDQTILAHVATTYMNVYQS